MTARSTDEGSGLLEVETMEDAVAFAEQSVHAMVGLPFEEALRRQATGAYEGTIVDIELRSLRELLQSFGYESPE